MRTLRWENISYLPQGSMNSLNPVIRVRDQFVDVIKAHSQLRKPEIQARIPGLLESVGLDPAVARMYAHELSGGMKQRVLTAMTMALEPDLLIADEPTTALDVTVQRLVMQNLADLRELGVTVLLITHDMGVHAQLADRVAVMYQGKMVDAGGVRQVFKAPSHGYTRGLIASIPTLDVHQRQPGGEGAGLTADANGDEPAAADGAPRTIAFEKVTQLFPGRAGTRVLDVNQVSFELSSNPPRLLSLVGASGSGKSTVARIILALQTPTAGRVTYGGKDIFHLSRREYDAFRRDVQPVFQDPYAIFNPFYRVDRVFWEAIKKFKLARSKSEAMGRIEDSLQTVQLRPGEVLGRYPHQLSGGQRQRLMLARAYLLHPSFLIADEPVSMLDAQVRKTFLDILIEFHQRYGMTTLFITHDLSTVAYLGGDMMTMFKGRIVEKGPVEQVLTNPTHEYTKLLVASVPVADPDRRWTDQVKMVGGVPQLVARR